MIRARIFRDGPGVWSFAIVDVDGLPFVTGHTDTWDLALSGAVGELQLFAGREKQPALRGPITPGDATVPRGNRRWRRVLGL